MELENREPSFFIILFVFFLIISVITVGFLYVKNSGLKIPKNIFNKKKEEINFSEQQYYTITLTTNAEKPVNYWLKHKDKIISSGTLKPNVKNIYSKAQYNETYSFYALSDDYYFNRTECYVVNDTICNLSLKKKGNFSLELVNDILYIHKEKEGVIQEPLLCISWTFDIYIVEIKELNKVQIPYRLKHLADVCYSFNGDINEDRQYTLNIERINPKTSNITFYLIDKDGNDKGIVSYDEDRGIQDIILSVKV